MSLSYIYLTQAGMSIGVSTLPTITGTLVKDRELRTLFLESDQEFSGGP